MNEATSVWVVDDDEAIRFVLERALGRAGYAVRTFGRVDEVRAALERTQPGVIVTDIHLPDADGLDLLDTLRERDITLPVIAMTAFSDLDQAVSAFRQGVFEYIPKPFDLGQVLSVVERAAAGAEHSDTPRQEVPSSRLIGESPPMQEVFRTVGRLSRSVISVLITGETGTGKDMVARALHENSPRSGGPYVAINTAAIPAELLESELFGHERGAFTGAHTRRAGRFEEAAGGTLFLDEIGDMPLPLQTRLLRVLAEGDYYRVGGRDLLQADVRVIAATHQDLEQKIREGSFREDLFHRLNVISIRLPALRERPDDIPLLARYFLKQTAAEMRLEEKRLRPETLEAMQKLPWPGNVRQLQNLCQHICVMAPGEHIFPQDLPPEPALDGAAGASGDWRHQLRRWAQKSLASGESGLLPEARRELEEVLFEAALAHTGGKRIEAAKLLGVGRNTLARKLKERD